MHTHTHKALIEKTPRNATAMAQASTCGVSCCFYYPAPLVTPAASLHGVHSITFPTVPGAKRLGLTSLQKKPPRMTTNSNSSAHKHSLLLENMRRKFNDNPALKSLGASASSPLQRTYIVGLVVVASCRS